MFFGGTVQDNELWKSNLQSYQKEKRTKKPFGKQVLISQRVTQAQVKQKDTRFHPILQTFRYKQDQSKVNNKQQIAQQQSLIKKSIHNINIKYDKGYDIINLHPFREQGLPKSQYFGTNNKIRGPIRNLYNPINNQKITEQMVQRREIRPLNVYNPQFDIVTCGYKNNNEERVADQLVEKDYNTMSKYWQTHDFNPVYGQYYNPKRQQAYQQHLHQQSKMHGSTYQKRLPPSYQTRQPIILDQTKPVPQSVKQIQQKRVNAKKRYQMRYMIEDEYKKRNQQYEDRQQVVRKNNIHNGRLFENISKQFNILNSAQFYPHDRTENLYNKRAVKSTWQELVPDRKSVKSSGFTM